MSSPWLSGETPPTDAEMKAEIERRRAARAAEETAQAEEKAPETEESGGASGVPEQREAEADTQAAPEEEQAAPVQEAAADAAGKRRLRCGAEGITAVKRKRYEGNRRIKMAELISGKTLAAKLKAEAAAEAAELREKGVHARLAVVIVGENPASSDICGGQGEGLRRMRPAVRRHRAAGRNHRGRASGKNRGAERGQDGPRRAGAAAAARAYPRNSASSTPSRRTRTWTASPQ